jgi:hypothetical protein
MNPLPQKDTIVYSRNGARARFVAKVEYYYLVYPEIEIKNWEGDTETDWGNITEWDEIFPKPPTEVLDQEIKKKQENIVELTNKARLLHFKINEAESAIRAQKDKFARYEKLKYLEDFIDKKITHYVKTVDSYSDKIDQIVIIDAAKAYDEDDMRYHRPSVKALVTLEGKTNGDLNWQLHRYYYHSQSHEIIPCKSYEEAVVESQKIFDKVCQDFLNTEEKTRRVSDNLIRCARNLNLSIPDYIESYLVAQKEKERLNKIERAKEELAKAQKNLVDLEAGIPSNSAPCSAVK